MEVDVMCLFCATFQPDSFPSYDDTETMAKPATMLSFGCVIWIKKLEFEKKARKTKFSKRTIQSLQCKILANLLLKRLQISCSKGHQKGDVMNKSTGPGTTLHSLLGDRYPFGDKKLKKKDKTDQLGVGKMLPKNWEHTSLDMEPHASLVPEKQNNHHAHTTSPVSKPGIGFAKGLAKVANSGSAMKTQSPKSNSSPNLSSSPKNTFRQQLNNTNDVTVYVGKNRTPYILSTDFLSSSSFFRKMIMRSHANPIIVDCEESVFENVMAVLRYKSIEAVSPLSDSDKFKLRRELEFFGIDVPDELQSRRAQPRQGHFPIADLPDFPTELTDPAKLVIVARLDDTEKGKCECVSSEKPTQWALSFHFRHAFCIGCSQPPQNLASKSLIEMFQAAALFFSHPDKVSPKKWFVICDSTCSLRFVTPKPCCICLCSGNKKKVPMWAVNSYHCHAFCTSCGMCAEGSTLVCIMFTVRYGGAQKNFKAASTKKEPPTENGCQEAPQNQSPSGSFSRASPPKQSPRPSLSSQPSL